MSELKLRPSEYQYKVTVQVNIITKLQSYNFTNNKEKHCKSPTLHPLPLADEVI